MPSFVYSCVVDPFPKFDAQLRVWVTTLVECAGVSTADLFVHIVRRESACPGLERYLDSRGIAFTYTTPFGDGRMGNRLEQLRTPALREREYAVLCDTDLAFLARLDPWIGLGSICAKEVDFANPPLERLEPLYRRAGFDRFPARKRCSFGDAETYVTNCNGGVWVLRTTLFDDLLPCWQRWYFWVLDQADLLGPYMFHVSQISFSLAVWEMGEEIVPLPKIANFPTHVPPELYDPNNDVPLVLHYHDRVDGEGALRPVGVAVIDRQIARANAVIARMPKTA